MQRNNCNMKQNIIKSRQLLVTEGIIGGKYELSKQNYLAWYYSVQKDTEEHV